MRSMSFLFRYPEKLPLPKLVMFAVILVICIATVFPFMSYVNYYDLSRFEVPELQGLGLCRQQHGVGMLEYLRALFVLLFVLPLCAITFMLVKTSAELRPKEEVIPMRSPRFISANSLSECGSNEPVKPTEEELSSMFASMSQENISQHKRHQQYIVMIVTVRFC